MKTTKEEKIEEQKHTFHYYRLCDYALIVCLKFVYDTKKLANSREIWRGKFVRKFKIRRMICTPTKNANETRRPQSSKKLLELLEFEIFHAINNFQIWISRPMYTLIMHFIIFLVPILT